MTDLEIFRWVSGLYINKGRLDLVEWNGGMEWWTGSRMEWLEVEWNGNFTWWSPLYKDHLLTKSTSYKDHFT